MIPRDWALTASLCLLGLCVCATALWGSSGHSALLELLMALWERTLCIPIRTLHWRKKSKSGQMCFLETGSAAKVNKEVPYLKWKHKVCSSAIIGSRLKQWSLDKTSLVGGQKKKVGAAIGGNGSLCLLLSSFLRGRDPAAEGPVPRWNVDLQAQLTVICIAEISAFQSRSRIKCGRDKKAQSEGSEGMQVSASGRRLKRDTESTVMEENKETQNFCWLSSIHCDFFFLDSFSMNGGRK